MAETTDGRYQIAVARADFLEGMGVRGSGVASHVVASWQRSASSGVQPSRVESPFFADLDVESRLVRCAEPVIDQLASQMADIPMCIALTDNNARLLARKDGSRSFGRVTDRVHFAQGFGYAEGEVGTNGVGTVLESGHSVHIVGAEHYVDSLQAFACAGAPVRDPFTGRTEGVLDISCFAEHSSPILHSLVRDGAAKIEQNLVTDRNQSQQALFDLYCRVDARSRAAVIAVGPSVTMANTPMQALLASHDREAVQDYVRFVMHRSTTVDHQIDLPSGTRVRLRGSTVTIGDDVAGMVGVVNRLSDLYDAGSAHALDLGGTVASTSAGPASAPALTAPLTVASPSSASAAWQSAAATADAALTGGRSVVVLGEPGSGRLTLLRQVVGRCRPHREIVPVEADELEQSPRAIADRVIAHPDRLVVLRHIDQVSARAGSTFVDRLIGAGRAPVIGATADESIAAGRSDLLSFFAASATVPPLRHRGAELTELIAQLLRDVAPHRDVRLSPDAQRIVSTFQWPGNIRQLRDTLTAAVAARPTGTIDVTDLPAYCQSTPGSALRPVDQAERDAIVSGLRRTGGNRKAAAAALGLARSTLYRKIHQYGITD